VYLGQQRSLFQSNPWALFFLFLFQADDTITPMIGGHSRGKHKLMDAQNIFILSMIEPHQYHNPHTRTDYILAS